MTIREQNEQREHAVLEPWATFADSSAGRLRPMEPCPYRTCFQRDRDRIIHSKAFRRLGNKTQVFISPEGDHYRARLTHTLEVAQIARTIARALGLNENLTEAIALGHDLGHTPFGHAGEAALDEVCSFGFRHNEQSLRVVDVLEDLNLTREVRNGIVCHTGRRKASTPEGRIIHFADRIAYINHDIDDAVRAGIIRENDIPQHLRKRLGETHGKRIDTLVTAMIEYGQRYLEIGMDEQMHADMMELRQFMISSELPEVMGMSDRIVVMHEGIMTAILDRKDFSSELILKYATSIGLSYTGSSGLHTGRVIGYRREPLPAARMIPFIARLMP